MRLLATIPTGANTMLHTRRLVVDRDAFTDSPTVAFVTWRHDQVIGRLRAITPAAGNLHFMLRVDPDKLAAALGHRDTDRLDTLGVSPHFLRGGLDGSVNRGPCTHLTARTGLVELALTPSPAMRGTTVLALDDWPTNPPPPRAPTSAPRQRPLADLRTERHRARAEAELLAHVAAVGAVRVTAGGTIRAA